MMQAVKMAKKAGYRDLQEVLEAGMDGMLNKPFDVNALQRVLQEVWQSRR